MAKTPELEYEYGLAFHRAGTDYMIEPVENLEAAVKLLRFAKGSYERISYYKNASVVVRAVLKSGWENYDGQDR